jgi:hypothetical protein
VPSTKMLPNLAATAHDEDRDPDCGSRTALLSAEISRKVSSYKISRARRAFPHSTPLSVVGN